MKWSEVRALFPDQWVIIDILKYRMAANMRIVEDVAVIESIQGENQGTVAWKCSQDYRKAHPQHDIIPIHTVHEELRIEVTYRV